MIYIALLPRKSLAGPIALGIAISLKGYPIAFLLLGLRQRHAESALALFVAVGLTLVSLSLFKGGIIHNLEGVQNAQFQYNYKYVLGTWSMSHSSDPYNGLRATASIALHAYRDFISKNGAPDMALPIWRNAFESAYIGCTFAAAAISSVFVLFVQAQTWRRITVLSITAILFPIVANDYKLIMLLPAALGILADNVPDAWRSRAFWLVAFLLIPKSYIYLYGMSISMLVNPILLISLWWVAISSSEPWKQWFSRIQIQLACWSTPMFWINGRGQKDQVGKIRGEI